MLVITQMLDLEWYLTIDLKCKLDLQLMIVIDLILELLIELLGIELDKFDEL